MDIAHQCLGAEFRVAVRGSFHQHDVRLGLVEHGLEVVVEDGVREELGDGGVFAAGAVAVLVEEFRSQVAGGDADDSRQATAELLEHETATVTKTDDAQFVLTHVANASFLGTDWTERMD